MEPKEKHVAPETQGERGGRGAAGGRGELSGVAVKKCSEEEELGEKQQ